MEVHGGNGTVLEQLAWQRNHARANHQGIRRLARFGISDFRGQSECLSIHGHIHNEGVATHAGLDILFLHSRLLANAVMLYQGSYLTAATRPVAETIHAFQWVGQVLDARQLTGLGHGRLSKSSTCVFYLITQRKLATLLRLSAEGSTTQYNS